MPNTLESSDDGQELLPEIFANRIDCLPELASQELQFEQSWAVGQSLLGLYTVHPRRVAWTPRSSLDEEAGVPVLLTTVEAAEWIEMEQCSSRERSSHPF